MKMFIVKQGTKVKVRKNGSEWEDHICKNENAFQLEDIIEDPLQKYNAMARLSLKGVDFDRLTYVFQKRTWFLRVEAMYVDVV